VIKGTHKATGEVCAVKQITGRTMKYDAILREVSILRRVGGSHPNVIGYRGYYTRGDDHFIVLEAATGGELFEKVIDSGSLGEAYSRHLFVQMLAGVQHMHGQGVAHRDLKLENVMLDGAGVPKWVDFGLAHVYRAKGGGGFQREMLRVFCGSRSYCPPEVLAGVPYDGFAADIWSLGVCLFAMVTGFFPLEEAGRRDWRYPRVARAQLAGESTTRKIFEFYKKECHLPPSLVELLDSMLILDPRARATLANVASSAWLEVPTTRDAGAMLSASFLSSGVVAATPVTGPHASNVSRDLIGDLIELDLDAIDIVHRCGGGHSAATGASSAQSSAPLALPLELDGAEQALLPRAVHRVQPLLVQPLAYRWHRT